MNKRNWNILVFPGGTENGIEIYNSLKYTKEVTLFSVSSKVKNHAEYIFTNHYFISDIRNDKCLDELNELIEKNYIDFIFPANSLVIDFLSHNRAKLSCEVIMQKNKILELVRSKRATYELFSKIIKTPHVYNNIDEIIEFPVFIKPDNMYGSQGAVKIDTLNQLKDLKTSNNLVITEYIPGDEFTIECFSSEIEVLYVSARTRERIRMGTSMHSEAAKIEIQKQAETIAKTIVDTIKIDGLWFFQLKIDKNNNLVLLEIEPRVAGTMAFSRCKGVNLPLAYLYYINGLSFEINNKIMYSLIIDRSLNNKYKTSISFDTVYIDLDNTIIFKNKINLDIIRFLYQCVNKNIKIILLSKSLSENKNKYLTDYRIINLFDEVCWIKEEENKSDYIIEKNSIFIDDSYSQRMLVQERLKIPTFDPSCVEVLFDNRI